MAHHKLPQTHRVAPHTYHVNVKEDDLYNDMHLICLMVRNPHKNTMSYIRKLHA